MSDMIQNTIGFVQKTLADAEGGHDWFHIERVWKNAMLIAKEEDCDMELVQLAALLHDIADSKFHGGDEKIGPKTAANWLLSQNYPQDRIDRIASIIRAISYKGGATNMRITALSSTSSRMPTALMLSVPLGLRALSTMEDLKTEPFTIRPSSRTSI